MPTALMLSNLFDIIEGVPTVDLSSGANNGDYVNVKNADRIGVLFRSGVGTAGDDPTLTIQQAKDNSGTSVKALDFTIIYRKQAATDLSSTTEWTETSQSASNTYTEATSAEQAAMWYVEFDASDLDVANGFDHIRATVADVGTNSQPGDILYIVRPKYPADPTSALSYL